MDIIRYRNKEYSGPEDLTEGVERYFEECNRRLRYYTKAGFLLFLQISNAKLKQYENDPKYSGILEWAERKIECQRNEMLLKCRGNPAGIIFDLKKNHNWKEENTVRVEGGGFRMVVEMAKDVQKVGA